MDYKKILFFLCVLTTTKIAFGMQKKIFGNKQKLTTHLENKDKKSNNKRELLKGLASLVGSAIFIQAIFHSKHFYLETINTNKNTKKNTPLDVLRDLPLGLIALSCYPLRKVSGLTFDKNEDAQNVYFMNIAVSSMAAIILGKYGITKLYNLFKNRKINQNELV